MAERVHLAMQNNWTTVTLVVMFGHFCYYMVLFSVGHIFVKVQEKKKTLRSARARAILFYGKGDFRILAPFLFVNVFSCFWVDSVSYHSLFHHPKNLIDGYDRPTLWSHLEG